MICDSCDTSNSIFHLDILSVLSSVLLMNKSGKYKLPLKDFEERKYLYFKKQSLKARDYIATSQCTDNWVWRKIENNRVSNKKLLIAKSNKKPKDIYGRVQLVPKNKKLYKTNSGKSSRK